MGPRPSGVVLLAQQAQRLQRAVGQENCGEALQCRSDRRPGAKDVVNPQGDVALRTAVPFRLHHAKGAGSAQPLAPGCVRNTADDLPLEEASCPKVVIAAASVWPRSKSISSRNGNQVGTIATHRRIVTHVAEALAPSTNSRLRQDVSPQALFETLLPPQPFVDVIDRREARSLRLTGGPLHGRRPELPGRAKCAGRAGRR
jgi:hypothetical protein